VLPQAGYDLSGVVESCGSDVTRFKVGDAVYGCRTLNLEDALDMRRVGNQRDNSITL
jgi:NADPH:quinone reductase-like Zn-dependent oxidoreductase